MTTPEELARNQLHCSCTGDDGLTGHDVDCAAAYRSECEDAIAAALEGKDKEFERLKDQLGWDITDSAYKPLVITEFRDRYESAEAQVTALRTALEAYQKIAKSISADLVTAHNARADQAAEWMREDDRDLRRDFYAATDGGKAALQSTGELTTKEGE